MVKKIIFPVGILTLLLALLTMSKSTIAQNWNSGSVPTSTTGFNTNIQLTHIGWGSHHGILFNAYVSPTLVSGDLLAVGNTKHSFAAGSYTSGAGAIMFLGNGGNMDFLITGLSTGAGQNVDWGVPKMRITRNGNVGIGTTTPMSKLEIADGTGGEQIRISRGTGAVRFVQNSNYDDLYLYNKDASKMYMYWKYDGNVGIGTTTPDYKLTVNGKIKAEEVQVVVDVPADYVFEEDYNLRPLNEVEKFVKENKHLPGMPSAQTLIANGWQVGEMNNKLLEKVEELTLYLIAIKKELDLVKKENNELKGLIQKK